MDMQEYAVRVQALQNRLYRTAVLYLGPSDAEEALDEAVFRGLKSCKKLREPAYFETWMTRILINVCRDEHRRRSREQSWEELPESAAEAFDALPLRFYPYDDGVYIPFADGVFGEQAQPGEPVVRHWFFRDLENPILAADVFSQYELEYLNDTVRRSEDVGRENHIYLHYTDWETFCAWCQVLEWKPLLKSGKLGAASEYRLYGSEKTAEDVITRLENNNPGSRWVVA